MVQQTRDAAFTKYTLPHAETGFSTSDKQMFGPVAPSSTTFPDLKSENSVVISKSSTSNHVVKDTEVDEISSGIKRPAPDSMSDPQKTSAGDRHIVYVRRKPEAERVKANAFGSEQDGVTQQVSLMKETIISDISGIKDTSSPCCSSKRCSSDHGNTNLGHVSPANAVSDGPVRKSYEKWEERYIRLQNFLKVLDQADPDDYKRVLRPLSPVELSRHAVDLEKRSIQLSLEEAKELQRVRMFDVLGKFPKNFCATSTHQQGPVNK